MLIYELSVSAPVRSSDRRKLKQQVIDAFALTPEEGNLLVPDLLVAKFNTHLDEQGVISCCRYIKVYD
jgi:translation initiation factor 2D